jgi:hypothetical protein
MNYTMDRVLALVRDGSRVQLLDTPGEIHILDHRLAGPCHWRPTRSPEWSDLWRNPGEPLRGPAPGHCISQSAKDKDPGCKGILTRICHSRRTASPPCLPRSLSLILRPTASRPVTVDHIRKEAGKAFADGVEDLTIKIKLPRGEAGFRTAGQPPGPTKPAPEPGEDMLELWGVRPLPGCPPIRKGGRRRPVRKHDDRPPRDTGTAKKVRTVFEK